MDPLQRPVVVPQIEIAVHRAAWWQVFGDRAPLAPRAQHVRQPVDHFSQVHAALATAAFGRWDQQGETRPLLIRQIAGIAQTAPIVASPILLRPHPTRPLKASLDYKPLLSLNMSSDRHSKIFAALLCVTTSSPATTRPPLPSGSDPVQTLIIRRCQQLRVCERCAHKTSAFIFSSGILLMALSA